MAALQENGLDPDVFGYVVNNPLFDNDLESISDSDSNHPIELTPTSSVSFQEEPLAKKPRIYSSTTRFVIQHIVLRNEEDPSNKWFDVWWLGCKKSTPESYSHLVAEGVDHRLLDAVVNKGLKARRTTWIGLSLRSGRKISTSLLSSDGLDGAAQATCVDLMTEIKVKYQCANARCVPYTFLNLLSLYKKSKDKLMKCNLDLCSLAELCTPVGHLFGKNLNPRDKDLAWLLEQTTGQFLVVDTLHCVGVDCTRQLVFDCALPTALKLSSGALAHCCIVKADEMRQII